MHVLSRPLMVLESPLLSHSLPLLLLLPPLPPLLLEYKLLPGLPLLSTMKLRISIHNIRPLLLDHLLLRLLDVLRRCTPSFVGGISAAAAAAVVRNTTAGRRGWRDSLSLSLSSTSWFFLLTS